MLSTHSTSSSSGCSGAKGVRTRKLLNSWRTIGKRFRNVYKRRDSASLPVIFTQTPSNDKEDEELSLDSGRGSVVSFVGELVVPPTPDYQDCREQADGVAKQRNYSQSERKEKKTNVSSVTLDSGICSFKYRSSLNLAKPLNRRSLRSSTVLRVSRRRRQIRTEETGFKFPISQSCSIGDLHGIRPSCSSCSSLIHRRNICRGTSSTSLPGSRPTATVETVLKKKVSILLPQDYRDRVDREHIISIRVRIFEIPETLSVKPQLDIIIKLAKVRLLETAPCSGLAVHLVFDRNWNETMQRISVDDIGRMLLGMRRILFYSLVRVHGCFEICLFRILAFFLHICQIVNIRPLDEKFQHLLEKGRRKGFSSDILMETQTLYIQLWTSLLEIKIAE